MMNPLKRKNCIFLLAAIILMMTAICGCPESTDQSAGPDEEPVTESTTDEQVESINWSTVSVEEFWSMVGESYEERGPRPALELLETGMNRGIVTKLEADQSRAAFLYELGRYDEAFFALVQYRLDESRPDLLRLRAEVLWEMSRYHEALRDYEVVLAAGGDDPSTDILASISRLYDDLGAWEKSADIRAILRSRATDDPAAARWAVYDAIQSMNEDRIRDALNNYRGFIESEPDAAQVLATMYINFLQGDIETAIEIGREVLDSGEFTSNSVMSLLNLDAEAADYEGFRNDLRTAMEKLNAAAWLEPSGAPPASALDSREFVGRLLSSASALELGGGNRDLARILADRAIMLNPYDYVAVLQMAAVKMTAGDIEGCFESMTDAVELSPSSDVRTRVRLLQFARLASGETRTPWDNDSVAAALENSAGQWAARYPRNPYFVGALAEVEGYRGNLEEALGMLREAEDMPAVSRESRIRSAYYLARLERTDEAWDIIERHVPTGTPLFLWPSLYEQEAAIHSDDDLAQFATMLRNHLDPLGDHFDFFAPAAR